MMLENVYAFRINLQISIFHLLTRIETRECNLFWHLCTVVHGFEMLAYWKCKMHSKSRDLLFVSISLFLWLHFLLCILPAFSFILTSFLWSMHTYTFIKKSEYAFENISHAFPYSLYLNFIYKWIRCIYFFILTSRRKLCESVVQLFTWKTQFIWIHRCCRRHRCHFFAGSFIRFCWCVYVCV